MQQPMLKPKDILGISAQFTERPLSKEAQILLLRGVAKYRKESEKYLDHPPTKEEAMDYIKRTLSQIGKEGGKITAKDVASVCKNLPYPLNKWFC